MEAILEMSALAKASHGRARRALALADAIQDVLHSPPGNCLTSFPLQSWPQAAAKVLRTDCLQASKFLEHALGVPAADRKTSDFYQAICGAPMQAAAKLWTSMFVAILLCPGCATNRLVHRANDQASTLTNLYYQQVLDNLAVTIEEPDRLPYFADPTQGRQSIQRAAQINYTLNWDLIVSAGLARLVDRYLVDKQSSQIQGGQTNLNEWDEAPTDNPDKLFLMRAAYRTVTGSATPEDQDVLHMYYYGPPPETRRLRANATKEEKQYAEEDAIREAAAHGHPASLKYAVALHSGWYCVGTCKDVPKGGCYVGHYGKTYVWVPREHVEELSRFTLVILDFVSASTTRPNLTGYYGAAPSGTAPLLSPREYRFPTPIYTP